MYVGIHCSIVCNGGNTMHPLKKDAVLIQKSKLKGGGGSNLSETWCPHLKIVMIIVSVS